MKENHKHNDSPSESPLLDQTRKFVVELMTNKLPEQYVYHNLQHTLDVVSAAEEIAIHSNLETEQIEVVMAAAYLHDIGYIKNNEQHEDHSITLSREFLDQLGANKKYIEDVIGCIEATKLPQNPKNLPQQVLCDADLYHLSSGHYFEKAELLRAEFSTIEKEDISESEWLDMSTVFIDNHQYFTEYGKLILGPRKAKILKKIKKRLKVLNGDPTYTEKLEKELAKLRERELKKPTRGIETMYRITSRNHMTLSGMADTKANIMISINSIMLSILVSVLIRKFEEYPNLIVPTLIIVVVCLTAIVFSILATRPNITSGKFTRTDIKKKRTNLLFFGNFHRMKLTDYMWGMREMLKDGDYLYGSLTKDIYFLGVVLGKKYRFLRISYTIFMYGFVIAILSFLLAVAFPNFMTPSIFLP
jgi:predicted metal-dependent HD superfamily phosphohydrolase